MLATLLSWRRLPGALCLMVLCVGDACAEIFGRKFGVTRWPFPAGTKKTLVGSAAFFTCSYAATMCFVEWFHRLGWTDLPASERWQAVALTHVVATALELVSPGNVDNLLVFFGSWPVAARLL